ncbi:MAG: AAA family ATPase [Thiomonas sp.]|uniref:ATP-dependent nuclease n=1 Tax=Thiomonas sp. TaxID=2047785 RepID=UPI002A36A16E|nr:AAA family ATPase [Thiomonas sp.]MDY0331798.1 AAA family ATPase [Thiomonas sp.]
MQISSIRLSNFQCFGPTPVTIFPKDITFLIGPNGSGKTAVLQALSRMFGFDPKQRQLQKSDFHTPLGEDVLKEQRSLWVEIDISFPELEEDDADHPTIPPQFNHMRLQDGEELPTVRIRLSATLDIDGDIQDELLYILQVDENNEPVNKSNVSAMDRKSIQVHYLPARRDPADHISYSANTLLGRLLRSADWTENKEEIKELTEQVSKTLGQNKGITEFGTTLNTQWQHLHKGDFFSSPKVTFASTEIDALLRHMSVSFSPAHDDKQVDFSRLSDGQKSLLYLSLVLTTQSIGRKLQKPEGDDIGFDPELFRPATFTLVAIEEPENSLSPQYLGRIVSSLKEMVAHNDAQALIATHAPSMLRRVEPEDICYLRLNEQRQTQVTTIQMPEKADEAYKFVREAVMAFPEVYFARLVVLGEGDSEEIVLPRILQAKGMPVDEQAICVAPLGGRHVNHFWRLLSGLGIPYKTLLDLDLARFGGGWGRFKVANDYLKKFHPENALPKGMPIPNWNDENPCLKNQDYFDALEERGVFFSYPLDLDFSMILAYPEAYGINDEDLEDPDGKILTSVLGKARHGEDQYAIDLQQYFSSYQRLFKIGSKPAAHIEALASLSDEDLLESMPEELVNMVDQIAKILKGLPE